MRSLEDRRLADQGPDDVNAYLGDLGRIGRLKEWQFRQTVDAIQILFLLIKAPWLHQVNWEDWKGSTGSK